MKDSVDARTVARILGVLLLAVGIAASVPAFAPAAAFDAPVLALDAAYRNLFGIFPFNAALEGAYVVFGACGLLAGMNFPVSVFYCRAMMWIYLTLALLGVLPLMNSLFGAAPLYGYDVALHSFVTVAFAYGGYGRPSNVVTEETPAPSVPPEA
jgi:hypothetical protein